MVVAAGVTTYLSRFGLPIGLAMATITCVVGPGWDRATRTATAREIVAGEADAHVSVDAVTTETPRSVADRLFDPNAVVRFVSFRTIGPSVVTALSYASFALVPIAGTP